MSDVSVDDTDTASISYSGSWTQLTGGPEREWQGTAHSTNQNGASATIRFHGTSIVVKCTVPEGNGAMTMNSNLDGQTDTLTRHSHDGATYYDDVWLNRGSLPDTDHVLVISNGGGPSDSPFQFDRFIITGTVIRPQQQLVSVSRSSSTTSSSSRTTSIRASSTSTRASITTSGSSAGITSLSSSTASSSASTTGSISSSGSASSNGSSGSSSASSTSFTSGSSTASATGGDKTVVSVQYITTQADGSIQTQYVTPAGASSASNLQNATGMIVGSVLGGVAILLLLLLLFLCIRRRRRVGQHVKLPEDVEKRDPFRRITAVTPFRLDTNRQGAGSSPSPNSLDVGPGMTPITSPTTMNNPSASATELARNVSQSTQAHSSHGEHIYISEKQSQLFRDNSLHSNHSSNTHDPDSSMYTSGPSPASYTLPPVPNTNIDAGAYRPRYLSGDTMFDTPPSNPSYASTPLGLVDTNDFPPSYQSARNHDSYPSIQTLPPPLP